VWRGLALYQGEARESGPGASEAEKRKGVLD
jgi:hypothetical protein